jgi:hypothetical protein
MDNGGDTPRFGDLVDLPLHLWGDARKPQYSIRQCGFYDPSYGLTDVHEKRRVGDVAFLHASHDRTVLAWRREGRTGVFAQRDGESWLLANHPITPGLIDAVVEDWLCAAAEMASAIHLHSSSLENWPWLNVRGPAIARWQVDALPPRLVSDAMQFARLRKLAPPQGRPFFHRRPDAWAACECLREMLTWLPTPAPPPVTAKPSPPPQPTAAEITAGEKFILEALRDRGGARIKVSLLEKHTGYNRTYCHDLLRNLRKRQLVVSPERGYWSLTDAAVRLLG